MYDGVKAAEWALENQRRRMGRPPWKESYGLQAIDFNHEKGLSPCHFIQAVAAVGGARLAIPSTNRLRDLVLEGLIPQGWSMLRGLDNLVMCQPGDLVRYTLSLGVMTAVFFNAETVIDAAVWPQLGCDIHGTRRPLSVVLDEETSLVQRFPDVSVELFLADHDAMETKRSQAYYEFHEAATVL